MLYLAGIVVALFLLSGLLPILERHAALRAKQKGGVRCGRPRSLRDRVRSRR